MAQRIETTDLRGVLRTPPDDRWELLRWAPAPALAPYAEFFWTVLWDLRGAEPHRQITLPYPAAHLVVEHGEAHIYGPSSRRFERVLAGAGRVTSVRFTPGGLRPLLAVAMSTIADRVLGAGLVPGLDERALARAVEGEPDPDRATAVLEDAVLAVLPAEPDPAVDEAARAVALLSADRSLTRVADLADGMGLSVRSLQRLFAEYVGLGPAWVIRRFRLHEAAAQATAGGEVDWARLATELGYYDQAHLVREFTATIGTPPARYAAGS